MSRLLYRLSYAALRGLLYSKKFAGAIENTLISLTGNRKNDCMDCLNKDKEFERFPIPSKLKSIN